MMGTPEAWRINNFKNKKIKVRTLYKISRTSHKINEKSKFVFQIMRHGDIFDQQFKYHFQPFLLSDFSYHLKFPKYMINHFFCISLPQEIIHAPKWNYGFFMKYTSYQEMFSWKSWHNFEIRFSFEIEDNVEINSL